MSFLEFLGEFLCGWCGLRDGYLSDVGAQLYS
jgi:hypothetical protein